MPRLFVLIALLAACSAQAGTESFVIAAHRGPIPVAVTIEMPADYVAVPITILSNEKDPLRNFENVQGFIERLKENLKKTAIHLRQGAIVLSLAEGESDGFSSFKSGGPSSSGTLFLAAPLPADRNIFEVSRDIAAVVQSVSKTDTTRSSVGATSLGVESPEQLRPRLLSLIQKNMEQARVALGNPKNVEVSGLESPVIVMQRDDRNVIAFLPYRLKVGQ